MKTVIFAGGRGSRLAEETDRIPKPMVTIGDMPILWHIMKLYSAQGFTDFVLCAGYKGFMIKEWFAQYALRHSDIRVNLRSHTTEILRAHEEPWTVTIIDTGLETGTAARLAKIQPHIGNETFMLTYGDGLADIDLKKLVAFHTAHGKIATVTAIQPEGRFGALAIGADNTVEKFAEKVDTATSWINGGFFVLQPEVFPYATNLGEEIMWERDPLENLARDRQLRAYQHTGFWKAMDTLRDRQKLEELWANGNAPWQLWHTC